MLIHPLKVNSKLLNILELQDELYQSYILRKLLVKKIKKNSNKLYEIGDLLNIDNIKTFSIEDLINIIMINCTYSIDNPPYKYYSYSQEPIVVNSI
uniref:Uncharacterized protein n=1 Tax=viral metagenome TaxID=1070528 RepID=A0A6C0DA24_9ZZZZ